MSTSEYHDSCEGYFEAILRIFKVKVEKTSEFFDQEGCLFVVKKIICLESLTS